MKASLKSCSGLPDKVDRQALVSIHKSQLTSLWRSMGCNVMVDNSKYCDIMSVPEIVVALLLVHYFQANCGLSWGVHLAMDSLFLVMHPEFRKHCM